MALASDRLTRRVQADFGSTEYVESLMVGIDGERVQAAVILWAHGDLDRLRDGVEMAHSDWRDALVRAGLADDDWPERLDNQLGV